MSYEKGKNKELDEAVDRLRKLLPGFYPGCTIEILPTLVYNKQHIGKRFTACKEAEDIKEAADRFEKNYTCWYIDKSNQYSINYELKHLKVIGGIDEFADPNPFSDGYRMKTIDEIISEYGSKDKVACSWTSGMDPLSGLPITNAFAKAVIRGNRLQCRKEHFKNPKTESFNWTISDQMITNKPLPAPKTEEPKELLVFGKFKIGQVVVSLKSNFGCREVNDLYEVSSDSDRNHLKYKPSVTSSSPDEWRAATEEETAYYKSGGKNIAFMKPLVFDTYRIGQIVVSLRSVGSYRSDGQLFEVLEKSGKGTLYYLSDTCSDNHSEWRAATLIETTFYWENKHKGSVHMKDMKKEEEAPKSEILVFRKYKIGDIVVSLGSSGNHRTIGSIYEVLPSSTRNGLDYTPHHCNPIAEEWRAATPEEVKFYKEGGRHINNMPRSTTEHKDVLVFDKYPIGSIVVSTIDAPAGTRLKGELFKQDKFSYNYRMKTVDELKAEFGAELGMQVPGNFSEGMHHLSGIRITDAFAKKVLERKSASNRYDFDHPHPEKDYEWIISKEMITNKSASGSSTFVEHIDVIGGDSAPAPAKKHEKPLLISDFTTAQLKPKQKRAKLSINS